MSFNIDVGRYCNGRRLSWSNSLSKSSHEKSHICTTLYWISSICMCWWVWLLSGVYTDHLVVLDVPDDLFYYPTIPWRCKFVSQLWVYNCCYIILHYSFVGQSNAYTLSDIPTLLRLHLHTYKRVGDKWGWCLGACNNTNFVINLWDGERWGIIDWNARDGILLLLMLKRNLEG